MPQQPALYDYAKLYKSTKNYVSHPLSSAESIQKAIQQANKDQQAIRIRASAHTLGGVTLPRKDERLIRTEDLDYYRFEEVGTITVGCGALLWDVRDFVLKHDWQMPVYNGGWAGPSVGGYISAGGMGLRIPPADKKKLVSATGAQGAYLTSISETHGGFWEHVASITFIDGTGEIREVAAGDELFQWLFGSYGQLGLFIEAKLKLLPLNAAATTQYPLGQSGIIPRVQIDDPKINNTPPDLNNNILFWFSYLVSPEQEQDAWNKLQNWAIKHAGHLHPVGGWVGPIIDDNPIGYRYQVSYKNFNPPLLYPEQGNFVLMGLMANFANVGHFDIDQKIFEIDADFTQIALENNFRLYLQAENISQTVDYKDYYNPEIYQKFKAIKQQLDPHMRFNPGVFFPDESMPPVKASSAQVFSNAFARLLASSE